MALGGVEKVLEKCSIALESDKIMFSEPFDCLWTLNTFLWGI